MIYVNKNIIIKKKNILIVTGKKSFYNSNISSFLKLYNCNVNIYFKKKNVPEFTELKQLILKKKKLIPDIIIGIGGGSVLDLSKLITAIDVLPSKFSNLQDIKFKKKNRLILIPTTAGSGAEATNFAVLYNKQKKISLISKELKTNKVYFYPSSLTNLSKKNKLASGLDVLCQAIESMFSKKSNDQSLIYSKKSLDILINNFLFYLKNSKKTYKKMLMASNYAGKAIKITKTNVPHALSYYLTSKHKIDHGFAVYLNLFGFLNFLYKHKYKNDFIDRRFRFLFSIFSIKNNSKFPLLILFQKIKKLIKKNISYKTFSINKHNEINKIIKNINYERLSNCPINLDRKDLSTIISY